MMFRVTLAIILVLTAIEGALAATAIEYGLIFGF
jgi:hypothetical protein